MGMVRLEFKSFEVSKLLVERNNDIKGGDFDIDVKQTNQINKKSRSIFRILFILTITERNKTNSDLIIRIEAYGYFKIIGRPTKKVFDNFIYISAPSIVYPYLRAFISNITAQIGMNSITLETLNFGAIPLDKDNPAKRPPAKKATTKKTKKKTVSSRA